MHHEWEASLGRRNAGERLAHLFCELHERIKVVHLAQDGCFEVALNQTDLGDATGLTLVHVNRILRELREAGLLKFSSRKTQILNEEGLKAHAISIPFICIWDHLSDKGNERRRRRF